MSSRIVLVALAVAATTLAGCQSADPAPAPAAASAAPAAAGIAALGADEILTKAKAALVAAKSFRAKGTLDQDGAPSDVDLKISGADFAVSMALGQAEVELLAVNGKKYIRPNEQFWAMATDAKQGKVLARGIGDRWVTGVDKDESFASLFTIGSVDELLKPTGTLSKGEEKEIGGKPAIGLQDSGDPDSVLWIATTGEPYPLQMVGKGSELTFSDFGATFRDVTAPDAKKVVDLGKLSGK